MTSHPAIACTALTALAALSSCTSSQPGRTITDIGYGSGAGLAVGAFRYNDDGIGAYGAANIEFGSGKGTNYDGTLGVGGFPGDPKTGESQSGVGVSAGVTRRFGDLIGLFAGGAVSWETTYYNYFDATGILDPSGNYHVTGDIEFSPGVEFGAHLMNEKNALAIRYNSAANAVILSAGFSF